MKQKDLAEEYADLQYKIQQDAPEESPDLSKGVFGHEDIVNAFNAGRESVLESMPGLVWNCFCEGLKEFYASCPIGWCYKILYKVNEFELFCNGCFIGRFFLIEHAKQAANEHYKKQIKQVLGL